MHIGLKSLDSSLATREVRHALLVHEKGEPDPYSLTFASRLLPDVQHTLAVVDLQPGDLQTRSDALAKTLSGRGTLRLVFVHAIPSREARAAASRIAERLQRTVLVADGEPVRTGDGGLFVPSDRGTGWVSFRPGRGMQHESQRFPKPAWEFSTFARPWAVSEHTTVEPLPSGVWVRASSRVGTVTGRSWLMGQLPCHPEIMNVVLGCPGGPPVPLDDVARFWETVLQTVRTRVRFVHFGPVSTPGGRAYGQELADRLGQQVVVYAGIPLETATGFQPPTVIGLHKQGTTESRPFVSELMYFPRLGQRSAPPPALFGLRQPVLGVPEIATGVYEYAADAVLEVVQSGLWMRPPVPPADADEVRNLPAAPGRFAIYYDRSTPSTAERMRALAEDMLWRLDSATRTTFQVAPADDPWPVLLQGEDDTWSLAVETAPHEGPAEQAEQIRHRLPGQLGAPEQQQHSGSRAQAPGRAGAVLQPEGETAAQKSGKAAGGAARRGGNPVARRARDRRNKAARPVTESAPATAQPTATGQQLPTTSAGSEAPASSSPGTAGPPRTRTESSGAAGTAAPADAPASAEATAAGSAASSEAVASAGPLPPADLPNGAALPNPYATGEATPAQPAGPYGMRPIVTSPWAGETNPYATDVPPAGPQAPRSAAQPQPMPAPTTPGPTATPAPTTPGPTATPAPRPVPTAPPAPPTPSAPPAAPTSATPPAVPAASAPPAASSASGPAVEAAPPSAEPAPAGAPATPPAEPAASAAPAARPGTPRIRLESAAPGGPAPQPDPEPGPPPVRDQPPAEPDSTKPAAPATPSAPAAPPSPGAAVPAPPPLPSGSSTVPGGSSRPVNTSSAGPVGSTAPGAGPGSPGTAAAPATGTAPAPGAPGVQIQPVPTAAACAAPGDRDIAKEREWVRRTFNSQFHTVSGSVSRIMSQTPGLRGASRADAGDALTDLVAVKLYLSGDSGQVDRAVRSATAGPHVPLARCVASGLLRLPSYRGPSLVRVVASAAERRWFREGRVVAEWGFCTARTNVEAASAGNTDFLVWSMTARRTNLLDPERPDQVVFVPGTSFKALRVDEDGARPSVLMRELLPSEIGEDGKVDVARVPLDEIALGGLEQALKVVAGVKDAGAAEPAPGSGWPPGLLSTRRAAPPAPPKSEPSKGATP